MDKLNPILFDQILDQYLFNNSMISDNNKPVTIEIKFMDIDEGKSFETYPAFNHRLVRFIDPVLAKAEIAGHLYLHYKHFDIDDCIDYVIF